MTRVVFYPYAMTSGSSKVLKEQFKALRVYPDGNYRPRPSDVVVNWGNANRPEWSVDRPQVFLNPVTSVARAVHKIDALTRMQRYGVHVPDFTQAPAVAQAWHAAGETLMARTLTRGNSGRGIHVVKPDDEFQIMYTEEDGQERKVQFWSVYVKPANEYRIHAFRAPGFHGHLIQHKRRRRGAEHDMYVRNADGGWVFAINDIVQPPEGLINAAYEALNVLGLHFGAVDCIVEEESGESMVLEVNTACGLDGDTTIEFYTHALSEVIAANS